MNTFLTSNPSNDQLLIAVIGACAVVLAALITAGYFRKAPIGPQRERRVCLHQNGVISTTPFRVLGSHSFEKNFKTGKLLLPVLLRECKYEVYERDSGKWIGRFTNPPSIEDEVIVINIEISSEQWESAEASLTQVNPH